MASPLIGVPYSAEAEDALVGGVLLDPDSWHSVNHLTPEVFFRDRNALVWTTFHALARRGLPIDTIGVSDELNRVGKLEAAGGLQWLLDTVAQTPSALYGEHWAGIVLDQYRRRQLIQAAGDIARTASEAPSSESALSTALEAIMALQQDRDQGVRMMADIVDEMEPEVRTMLANPGQISGTITPWPVWTRATQGFNPGHLVMVVARPGRGKTRIGGLCLLAAAEYGGVPVMFSLEMGRKDLLWRFAAAIANVDVLAHRTGKRRFTAEEETRLEHAFARLRAYSAGIDDRSGLTVAQMRAEVARVQAREGAVSLVVVDYAGLVSGQGENETSRFRSVTQDLKAMARALEVPVLALAQLNRDVEKREKGKPARPKLSDLYQGGEQAPDQIWAIHHRDVDLAMGVTTSREPIKDFSDDTEGVIELRALKHRHGIAGQAVFLRDDPATGQITQWFGYDEAGHWYDHRTDVDRSWQGNQDDDRLSA